MPAVAPKTRSYRIATSRPLILLLIIEGILWISAQFGWFDFNQHKVSILVIALLGVGLSMVVLFLWLLRALVIRRRIQFGIRSLFLLTLVIAIPCSWLTVDLTVARRQRELVEKLTKKGGRISYDYQEQPPPGGRPIATEPPVPLWLRKLLGDDLFVKVTGIDFQGPQSKVSDIDLHDLERLPQLDDLRFKGTAFGDAELEQIQGLTQLQSLNLIFTKVDDMGLQHLKGLKQLRGLNLIGTAVTNAGLEYLSGLSQFEYLYLDFTKVSDVGLEYLKRLPRLKVLFLRGTDVTDAGVEKLRRALPNCMIRYDGGEVGPRPDLSH